MALVQPRYSQILDANGDPAVGAKVYFSAYGTDPVANHSSFTIYSDESLATSATNPQVADSFGRMPNQVYIGVDYAYLIKDADDNIIEGPIDRRISSRINFETSQSIDVITLTETSANNYSMDPGWTKLPPNGVYPLMFPTTNTGAVTATITGITGSYSVTSKGVALTSDQITANVVHLSYFNGTSFDLFNISTSSSSGNGMGTQTVVLTNSSDVYSTPSGFAPVTGIAFDVYTDAANTTTSPTLDTVPIKVGDGNGSGSAPSAGVLRQGGPTKLVGVDTDSDGDIDEFHILTALSQTISSGSTIEKTGSTTLNYSSGDTTSTKITSFDVLGVNLFTHDAANHGFTVKAAAAGDWTVVIDFASDGYNGGSTEATAVRLLQNATAITSSTVSGEPGLLVKGSNILPNGDKMAVYEENVTLVEGEVLQVFANHNGNNGSTDNPNVLEKIKIIFLKAD